MAKRLIRLPEVLRMTGIGKTLLYELMKAKQFPSAVPLGGRAVSWVEDEIEAWIRNRIELRDAA